MDLSFLPDGRTVQERQYVCAYNLDALLHNYRLPSEWPRSPDNPLWSLSDDVNELVAFLDPFVAFKIDLPLRYIVMWDVRGCT